MKSTVPVKAADIVVCGMNDFLDRAICQKVSEGSDVIKSYRIDNIDLMTGSNLNKTELLGVMMEAVGFGVNGNRI